MTEHTCPYNAVRQIAPYSQLTECGSNGWLCERCQVDAARLNALVIAQAVVESAQIVSDGDVGKWDRLDILICRIRNALA